MAPELRKFAAGTAPPGWNRHLWKILALGLLQQSGSPLPNRGGRPPTTERWGPAENKEPASLASQRAFLSASSGQEASISLSPHRPRSEGARLQ